MIGRRNIRVKVMQSLYGLDFERDSLSQEKAKAQALNQFHFLLEMFEATIHYFTAFWMDLFLYMHHHYKKYIGTLLLEHYDRFYNSDFYTQCKKSTLYARTYKATAEVINPVWMQKLYAPLAQKIIDSKRYLDYLSNISGDRSEQEILLYLWDRHFSSSEQWQNYIDEYLPYADCDDEMIRSILSELTKTEVMNLPVFVSQSKRQFGENLLTTYISKQDEVEQTLTFYLQNWRQERLLQIDRIVLKLGITELLFFEEIPATVVINEYVDISKMYSNYTSGTFVNGLLDQVSKDRKK